MLTVAVSTRSLFHMEDSNQIFMTQGQDAFNEYMKSKETIPLRPGAAFPLIKKLLKINDQSNIGEPLINVVMLSRSSPEAGLRAMNSVEHYGLKLESAVFSQGSNRYRYAQAMGADLFLSANPDDVKNSIDQGLAAALMVPCEREDSSSDPVVRIAFDGDAVLFSAEADECYQREGLEAFQRSERANAQTPLGAGPFKAVLERLCAIQKLFPHGQSPLRLALVTARGLPAHARVMHTLAHWGIRLDEAVFAAGQAKGPLLKAFGADIFFDDTQKNIDSAEGHDIPGGLVPFGSGHGITTP